MPILILGRKEEREGRGRVGKTMKEGREGGRTMKEGRTMKGGRREYEGRT
jgi:hypothetical protein